MKEEKISKKKRIVLTRLSDKTGSRRRGWLTFHRFVSRDFPMKVLKNNFPAGISITLSFQWKYANEGRESPPVASSQLQKSHRRVSRVTSLRAEAAGEERRSESKVCHESFKHFLICRAELAAAVAFEKISHSVVVCCSRCDCASPSRLNSFHLRAQGGPARCEEFSSSSSLKFFDFPTCMAMRWDDTARGEIEVNQGRQSTFDVLYIYTRKADKRRR